MAKRRIEVDIVANDEASRVFQTIRTGAASMSSTLMSALGTSASAVTSLDNALRTYNASMYRYNRVVGSVVRSAGDSIYNFTRDAINNFSALEQQHAKTMGAMATDYGKTAEAQKKFLEDSEKLKQQAITLGTSGPNGKGSLNTVYDVSYAQTALVKSGMSADDILGSNAIESILKFAGGNDLDIDTATMFAVNLATVFDKPVEEWGKMLDMVTKAADISVIDVEDIMDSLTYTGGIAAGLDRDLEETLGIISVMGQAGLRGRVAGTGLQAFFTRILSAGELSDKAIGNAPSEYVGNMYNAFVAEAVNPDGSFKEMDEVASLLDTAMSTLDDQEQAWFAKKLFGLYQMKAAYAITGAVDEDANLITDFIDQIENQSAGTNDTKYELMQASQYGKLESLKNAWEGIKTDVGDRLSPIVTTTADELLRFLGDPQNYEFDVSRLRDAISESGALISERYGEELGEAVANIGNFGVDAGIITEALIPQAGGIIGAIGKLAQGDIPGALDEFAQGIKDTNENIDGLPDDLQGAATAASNVITAFTTLSTINFGTQILQIITSAFNTFVAKPISWMVGKITSGSTTISSVSSVVNANYASVNTSNTSVQTGTASVNIGQIPLMNVSANIVNVYGGFGNPFSGGGGGGLGPLLPSGGGGFLPLGGGGFMPLGGGGVGGFLPSFAGASTAVVMSPLIYAIAHKLGLFGGSSWMGQRLLTGNSWVGQKLLGDGTTAARLWNIGGKQMTASQIATSAGRMLGLAGTLAMVASVPSSGIDWGKVYGSTLQEGIDAGYDNKDLRQYLYDNWQSSVIGADRGAEWGTKNWAVQTFDAQTEMYGKWLTVEGATEALNAIKEELETQGELSEQFLSKLVTNEGSTGGRYAGSQADLEFLFSILFNKEYDKPWMYSGSFADEYSTKFARSALDNGLTYDLSTLMGTVNETAIKTNDTIGIWFDAIERIQSPNINVNVTTRVDKSGNATSNVDINGISRGIARRGSQYGQVALVK